MPATGRAFVAALAVVLVASGCAPTGDGPDADGTVAAPVPSDPEAAADGVVVLPPADTLAAAERARIRDLVDRVVATASGDGVVTVLEPVTAGSLADTLDIAARRVGGGGRVCMLGARGRATLTAVLARYPAVRTCVVPGPLPSGVAPDRAVVEDVDLVGLGRALGAAARAAAGDGAVLLLDGGDALLDIRLRRGVEEAVLGVAGGSGPTFGVVTTAADAVALLDEQAAIGAGDVIPEDPVAEGRDGFPPGDLVPSARSLRPVEVVILDASPASAALAPSLAERGVRVVVPTSLLDAGLVAPGSVVLHWAVRWDEPLAAAIARPAGETSEPEAPSDPFVLVPGPATTTP